MNDNKPYKTSHLKVYTDKETSKGARKRRSSEPVHYEEIIVSEENISNLTHEIYFWENLSPNR